MQIQEGGEGRSQSFWKRGPMLSLAVLIIAGEAIFFLPFVLPRVFRVTLKEVFEINNLQLGALFSVYGGVAIGAYLFGGPLADRFQPRNLMAMALWATGLSGLVLATLPDLNGLIALYAFWGISTILLFWAALMRATRELGDRKTTGLAFAFVEGGRGAIAALIATLGVSILTFFMPEDVATASDEVRAFAFQRVILYISGLTFITGWILFFILGWVGVDSVQRNRISFNQIKEVVKMRRVWLQAIIIICAYSGYRVTDVFSDFAQDYLGMDEIAAAGFTTNALWLRPIAAVLGGVIALRFATSTMIMVSFLLVLVGSVLIGTRVIEPNMWAGAMLVVVSSASGLYALRGLYFAVMEEARIPLLVTGTVVGLASIIGYLPDVYMAAFIGWLQDRTPGAEGMRHVFIAMGGFALCGFVATVLLRRNIRKRSARLA